MISAATSVQRIYKRARQLDRARAVIAVINERRAKLNEFREHPTIFSRPEAGPGINVLQTHRPHLRLAFPPHDGLYWQWRKVIDEHWAQLVRGHLPSSRMVRWSSMTAKSQ